MSLNLTAAYRIKKRQPGATASRKNPLKQLHKKSSSASPRKPSGHASTPPLSSIQSDSLSSLWSLGWPTDNLPNSTTLPTSVPEAITYVLENQFTPLPPTLVGLGLSRDSVADILNFRKSLPPVVLVNHLHALLPSRTETERSINALVADGTLRRVNIRTGTAGSLEGVIRTDDFLKSIAQSSHLDSDTKDTFLELFNADPSLSTITSNHDDSDSSTLPKDIIMSLLSAGFLTINSSNASSSSPSANIDITALTPTTAMKTLMPLPEKDNTHLSTLASLSSISSSNRKAGNNTALQKGAIEYTITPPNLGLLTNLHSSSKSHMLDILRKCPHREATMTFLREKWNGGVAKGKKKELVKEGKFEGRTRKWRENRGVTVEWVVAGLMGAGVLENFEAVGIGMGVRLVKGN
ncbi:hypothetical protein ABW19_dt0208365 [Dactylella cylindrospora]|nr:hypothetical protein ABW19_dt0208365 [Dactylella cylindrospora]